MPLYQPPISLRRERGGGKDMISLQCRKGGERDAHEHRAALLRQEGRKGGVGASKTLDSKGGKRSFVTAFSQEKNKEKRKKGEREKKKYAPADFYGTGKNQHGG